MQIGYAELFLLPAVCVACSVAAQDSGTIVHYYRFQNERRKDLAHLLIRVSGCTVCIVFSCLVCSVVVVLCELLSSYVYLLYYVCIAVFNLDAGLLDRRQYSEGPATGHLDTSFS